MSATKNDSASAARGPVLVTGGTGFLGEHLVRALREAHQTVRVLCRQSTPELAALGASIYQGDLLDDTDDGLGLALDGCKEVYHLAGLVSRDPKKGPAMMRLHVEGTRRLLHAAKAAGVSRLLIASTSGTIAISREPEPIPDESWPYPVDLCGNFPYYLSKIYQEKLVLDLGTRLGLDVVCVNPSLLLGPGDRRGSSTEDVRKFLCGELPAVPSGGVSFVDVRDVATTCIAAMARGRSGGRYLLGGPNWTCREFLGRLERVSKVSGPWLRLPSRWNSVITRAARAVDSFCDHRGITSPIDRVAFEMGQLYWYCDSSLAKRELGFSPRDPAETLDDTVRDIRASSPL